MVTDRAVLAGGCFWGMQDLIRKLPGVESTRVGYTGGDVPNATYRNHGMHAEGIEIFYDPSEISYRDLLEFFFQIHDPTTPNRQGNDIHFVVSDNGIGIPSDDIDRVVVPWAQINDPTIADTSGSGLGLPIVSSLVDLHGGTLDIESEEGKGTTVTVTLSGQGAG